MSGDWKVMDLLQRSKTGLNSTGCVANAWRDPTGVMRDFALFYRHKAVRRHSLDETAMRKHFGGQRDGWLGLKNYY